MSLHTFLTRERPPNRTLAMGLGVIMVGAALAMGHAQDFSNWPGVAFLGGAGISLVAAGLILSESKLQWLFALAIVLNVAVAVLSLLGG